MSRYFLILFVFLNLGCFRYARKKLSIKPNDKVLENKPLRTDGIYLAPLEKEVPYFVLYANGVIFKGVSRGGDKESVLISFNRKYKPWADHPIGWGSFKISSNIILVETWISGDLGPYDSLKATGRIVNDSTIILGDNGRPNNTYYFHALEHKPDSTMRWFR
ncbi:MAG: hypothetical protein AAF798_07995 [Bacteroidota bacterium]